MKFELFTATILTLIFLTSAASLQCNFVGVNFEPSLEGNTTTVVNFALDFSNTGLAQEVINLHAQCPSGVECSFDSSSFNLPSGQNAVKHFYVNSQTAGNFEIPLQVSTISQNCQTSVSANIKNSNALNSQNSNAGDALSVKLTGDSPVNARPGDSVKYEFELKNNLNKKIFVALKNGLNPFKDSTFFEFNDVELLAGQTKIVTARIVVPPGSPGGQFTANLVIDAQDCCSQKLEYPVVVTVHGPKISLDLLNGPSTSQCIKLNRGEEAKLNFSIRNNEELNGPFKFVIANDEPKLLITTTTGTFSLDANEQLDSSIVIKSSNTTTLDTYKYTLEGKYNQFTFLQREYCVDIVGYSNVEITNVDKSKLTRGSLETLRFNITNTGNVEDEFVFTLPIYARFTSLEVETPKVTLAPGQTKTITLVLGTDIFTPLGAFKLPIRVDSKKQGQSKVFQLNLTFYSSSTPGSSLIDLVLQDSQLRVVPGDTKHFTFYASNFAEEKLRNAQVTISGIPSDWTSSQIIDLDAGESKEIIVSVTVPKSENRQSIPIQLTLTAKTANGQEETITRDANLLLPSSDLAFVIQGTLENRNFNGEVTSVTLNLIVTNNGQKTLTDLTPALLANQDNYLLSFKADQTQLVPGQSTQVQVTITPKTSTDSANVELQFESGEVEGQSKTILLPAMTISTGSGTILKIVAIFFLLIGISYLLAKEQNQI